MKPFYISCLVSCIAAILQAQQPAPQPSLPPLPPGTLLKRAPDNSSWTVTSQGRPTEEREPVKTATSGEERPKEKEAATRRSTVVKTGSTILEQIVETDGNQNQIWHYSGVRITPVSGSSNAIVCPDYGGGDIFSVNFASSDFAGLDWISKDTYAGIVKYEGADYILFKGTVSPLSVRAQIDEHEDIEKAKAFGQPYSEKLTVPAIAYIDLESRLPAFVQFGNEKRTYQFQPPPTAPLKLPPDLAVQVQKYQEKIRRLSAPPVRPF